MTNAEGQPTNSETEQEAALDAQLAERIAAYLHEAPTSEFQGLPIKVIRHWEGHDNLLWQVQAGSDSTGPADTNPANTDANTHANIHAVVKLFLDAGQARGRRQFDGQTTFAPLGSAPPPLWFDRYPQGLARQVLVYRWIDGDEINLHEPDPADATQTDAPQTDIGALEKLGQTIAGIHNAPIDAVRRFCPHPVNLDFFWRIEGDALQNVRRHWAATPALHSLLGELAQAAEDAVQRARPLWQTAAPTPVHGDLQPENCLIQTDGIPILVDWEMYGLGDPALDVARFLFHIQRQSTSEHQARFLDAYLTHAQQSRSDERIETYRRLLSLQALSYLLNGVHHALHPENAEQDRSEVQAQIGESLPFIRASVEATLTQTLADFGISSPQHAPDVAVEVWENHIAAQVG